MGRIDVLAVEKRPNADAHTALAAGGINALLATVDREDAWQQHAADTLSESCLVVCLLRLWFRERSSR